MTQVVTNSRPSPRHRLYPIRVNPSYKVGICALFAQIPGEGASPRVGASWKGAFTLHEAAPVERPPPPPPPPPPTARGTSSPRPPGTLPAHNQHAAAAPRIAI